MGNQQTICCADTTGRMDLELASSSGDLSHTGRGKPRLLRRFIDTIRPVGRRDQVGPHHHQQQQMPGFFKGKFASPTMEIEVDPSMPANVDNRQSLPKRNSISAAGWDNAAQGPPPPPQEQLRSLSSMSTSSGFGERARETRSDRFTRRASYCSDREGCEDERERLEPEGTTFQEATE